MNGLSTNALNWLLSRKYTLVLADEIYGVKSVYYENTLSINNSIYGESNVKSVNDISIKLNYSTPLPIKALDPIVNPFELWLFKLELPY